MNRLAIGLIAVFIALACQKKENYLQVTVEPPEPIVIPEGKTFFNGTEISAPWYTIDSITLNWNTENEENGVAQIVAITSKSKINSTTANGQQTTFTCAIDGDILNLMFGRTSGKIIIKRNTPQTSAIGVVCYGFTLPSPIPEQFNIPTTVKVYAAQVDDKNYYKTIGRVTTTTRITLK